MQVRHNNVCTVYQYLYLCFIKAPNTVEEFYLKEIFPEKKKKFCVFNVVHPSAMWEFSKR